MNSTTIKTQMVQADMIRQISTLLKVTACLSDSTANKIQGIVSQLESLADDLDEELDEISPRFHEVPALTIV